MFYPLHHAVYFVYEAIPYELSLAFINVGEVMLYCQFNLC